MVAGVTTLAAMLVRVGMVALYDVVVDCPGRLKLAVIKK